MQKLVNKFADQRPLYRTKVSSVFATAALLILTGLSSFSIPTYGLAQESGSESDTRKSPQVTGFRSAQFGMSESETLEAIQRDFPDQHQSVTTEMNEEDRTSSLVVIIEEIFTGSDSARIAYIHGYNDKKLIQVNVIWGSSVTSEANPQSLVTTANVLRAYFIQLGFDPKNTVINTRVDDRVFVVFRATDELGRMALLQLISKEVPADKDEKEEREPQFMVDTLLLSYIENFRNPDVFRIKKGEF